MTGTEPAPRDIRALTGLRGVAAVWVVAYHYDVQTNGTLPLLHDILVPQGYLAVDVFFALSGFIMTLSYGHMFRRSGTWDRYGAFLWRRLARVYPAYLAVTLVLIAVRLLLGLQDPPMDARTIAANILLVQSWGFSTPVVPVTWSLSVEFGAYLLFPLLLALTWRSRPVLLLVTVAACIASLWWLQGWVPADPGVVKRGPLDVFWGYSVGPMLRCLAGFTLGIVACRLCEVPLVAARIGTPSAVLAIAGALVAAACLPGADLAVTLLAPVLVASLACGAGPVVALLGSTAIVRLGDVSYSLYLWHQELLRVGSQVARRIAPAVGTAPADFIGLALTGLVCLAVATLSWRLIERPMRRWLLSLSRPATRAAVVRSEAEGRRRIG